MTEFATPASIAPALRRHVGEGTGKKNYRHLRPEY